MANTMMVDDPRRARIEARIMERLQRLDDATLRELDEWLSAPVSGEGQEATRKGGMTRRQVLLASLLGGAAVAGAGVAGNVVGQSDGMMAGASTVAEMAGTVDRLRDEAATMGERLQEATGLIDLYDEMEQIDLDGVVSSGMNAVAAAIGRTAQGAHAVREGMARARHNINQLDEGLAILDSGLVRAEQAVSTLSGLMQALEDRLRAAGEPVAPITDALGSFFTGLISKIPFGVGDRIVQTIERIQAVIGAIPESIENINRDLIEPLRAKFFPREGDDIQVRLLEPLTDLLFTPVDSMLSTLANLAETWRNALEEPAREKIEARETLRKQIVAYRSEKNL